MPIGALQPGLLGYEPKSRQLFEKKLLRIGIILIVGLTAVVFIVLALLAQSLNQWAVNTEKFWSLLLTVSKIVGGAIGLWFIWLKFIKTREFALKIEIIPTNGKIFLPDRNSYLHWLNIKLENKGTAAAVAYLISVTPIFHRDNITVYGDELKPCGQESNSLVGIVDIGAASYEHYTLLISELEAQAITFKIKVTVNSSAWLNYMTVPNIYERKDQTNNA